MRLEWDPVKARLNIARHGISFTEASTVFDDPLAITVPDPDHSAMETTELTIGMGSGHLLVVVYHAQREDRIRIIGARPPTRRERRAHEEAR